MMKYGIKPKKKMYGGAMKKKKKKMNVGGKAKPDYIDLDKDGNKKESMKQAAKDMKDNKMYGVPLDEDNMDYAEIKRQVDAGELTIEDAD